MALIDERAIRSAERAIDERKRNIARQWDALHERSLDAVTHPATLGALTLAGGVAGWRSARRSDDKHRADVASCDRNETKERSGAGPVRSLLMGLLRGMASMATEELLRAATATNENAAQAEANQDVGGADLARPRPEG